MKYACIEAHAGMPGITQLCRLLGVARSGYYAWKVRGESRRARQDRELLTQIEAVHRASRETLWCCEDLARTQGAQHRLRQASGGPAQAAGRHRGMPQAALPGHRGKPPQHPQRPISCNVDSMRHPQSGLGRGRYFHSYPAGFPSPGRLAGFVFAPGSGLGHGRRPNLAPVLSALNMALLHRQPQRGLVHHTDQGTLYAARAYRESLLKHGLRPSMSRRGNCYDNAVAESFFSTLKNELVHHRDFHTRDEARAAIFEYIEVFYNRQRRHQTLGYLSPMQFEQQAGVA
ncbi:MAG: IS3 family transposase [Zoogloeaceae bacterium]|nr:IS3 family transposase [Zoogloeaceae bacterium]